jgi:hypothetical protein
MSHILNILIQVTAIITLFSFLSGWESNFTDAIAIWFFMFCILRAFISFPILTVCLIALLYSIHHIYKTFFPWRIEMKKVIPKAVEGWNVSWNLNIFSGPKLTIVCGNCELTFKKRVDVVDHPPALCPYCNAVNIIPVVVT